ncbi:uncharacterized protein MELLADRAFT_105718 [Melampsora larici-populina 98AG31]|uniref:Uncharacterized protein n=1 Tax=Melampsora larici-populina (strain 98AG31 / pathotype 3-4-7) TaxID=747676 RepID=F4RJ51_MELLP|nr:uncharacterized protein MELLADRAFT_105718 [Melampsora larici-populina 98AG31]EGG07672.1 hypothetical protein MELLADRAFT_105718 [Melampsora larici-populina 98AG31]
MTPKDAYQERIRETLYPLFLMKRRVNLYKLFLVMPSSQSHETPSTASRPQRLRKPPSNPGMISPSPDSRRRVSVDRLPRPSQRTSSSTVIEVVDVTTEDDDEDVLLDNSSNKGNPVVNHPLQAPVQPLLHKKLYAKILRKRMVKSGREVDKVIQAKTPKFKVIMVNRII